MTPCPTILPIRSLKDGVKQKKWLEVDKHFFETIINDAFPRSACALCVLALDQTRVQRRTKVCAAARAFLAGGRVGQSVKKRRCTITIFEKA